MDLFMRTIMEAQSWMNDTSLLPLPWRSCDGSKGLGYKGWSGEGGTMRVGVMRDDGRVRPISSMRRALDGVVEKLRGSLEIVEVEPKFFEESWELVVSPAMAPFR
jgi:amidase